MKKEKRKPRKAPHSDQRKKKKVSQQTEFLETVLESLTHPFYVIDAYIAERTDVKSGTATFYGHTRRNLTDFFGADKPLREIMPGSADQWRAYLAGQGLADNTVRRRCGMAKQFFRAAVRRGLISSNPFEDLKASVKGNAKRLYFITREEAEKVLEACPDSQWRGSIICR